MARPRPFARLWREYLRRHWPWIALAGLLMAVEGSSVGLLSYMLEPMFDTVFVAGRTDLIPLVGGAIFGLFALRGVTGIAQRVIMARVSYRASADLQQDLLTHVLRLDSAFFAGHSPGLLIERVQGDVQAIQNIWTSIITNAGRDGIGLISLVVVAILVDPIWTLVAVVGRAAAGCAQPDRAALHPPQGAQAARHRRPADDAAGRGVPRHRPHQAERDGGLSAGPVPHGHRRDGARHHPHPGGSGGGAGAGGRGRRPRVPGGAALWRAADRRGREDDRRVHVLLHSHGAGLPAAAPPGRAVGAVAVVDRVAGADLRLARYAAHDPVARHPGQAATRADGHPLRGRGPGLWRGAGVARPVLRGAPGHDDGAGRPVGRGQDDRIQRVDPVWWTRIAAG